MLRGEVNLLVWEKEWPSLGHESSIQIELSVGLLVLWSNSTNPTKVGGYSN